MTAAPRLTRFLLGSAAVHALLGLWVAGVTTRATWSPGETWLNVELADDADAGGVTAPAAMKTPPSPRDLVRQYAGVPAVAAASPDPDTRVSSDTKSSEGVASAVSGAQDSSRFNEGSRNHLLGQLHTALSRHLVYPPLARQRGWEGTVLLGLRVEADGALEQVRLRGSSGYDVLDQAAVESLHRVGRLAEATAWLRGRALELQMPVIYRITER
jgi:TonB family protein